MATLPHAGRQPGRAGPARVVAARPLPDRAAPSVWLVGLITSLLGRMSGAA